MVLGSIPRGPTNKKYPVISIQTSIHAPLAKVWERYTQPEFVMQWNHASDDWTCPKAENDLRVGGKFNYRMEAKDGSVGFDFTGTYTEVAPQSAIAYVMDDGRKAEVRFSEKGEETEVNVAFDPENENPIEMQRQGWQAILDHFKNCAEER